METTKTFNKTFKGEYTPIGYHSPIDVEIDVDFIGIETQAELNQLIFDGEPQEYKVKSIWAMNDNRDWEDFKHEFSGDFINCRQTDQVDNIITSIIDKEAYEQARKNG